MSYLDRTSDRLSRRSAEQQQPQSPFRRARENTNDFDLARSHSPGIRTSPQNRTHLNKTGTLRGAFEATRVPTVSEGKEEDQQRTGLESIFASARGVTSPFRRRGRGTGNGLTETYERSGEVQGLQDEELEDPLFDEIGTGLGIDDGASFLDGAMDDSPRRKASDHINDERRLRRATMGYSPVLSKGKAGTGLGLMSENLQRREEEIQNSLGEGAEDNQGPGPSLNLPSTWGSRATNRRDWMKDINRRSESRARNNTEGSANDAIPRPRLRFDSTVNPPRGTERSPRRTSLENRGFLRERSTDGYNQAAQNDEQEKPLSEQQSKDGATIPNTPVSIYRNSTFNKRSPTKRDSQDLLRRLSRTESPKLNANQNGNHLKTPEPTKPPERHIYDKTPVVTGAWIDTPMTEKATQPLAHQSQEAASSPGKGKEPDDSPLHQRAGSRIETQPQSEPRKSQEKDTGPEKDKQKEKGKEESAKAKPPIIKPELPKSGLETFIRDFQADDERSLGDDTIESLEMLLEEPEEKPVKVKTEAEEDAEYEKAILKKLEGANPTAPKNTEADSNEPNSQLEKLARRIKEVTDGMCNLETQFNHAKDGDDHHNYNVHPDGRVHTAILLLPYLWRRDPISRRIRPTRLGWCTLFFFLWLFSESTMCDYYCHPTYATVCNDNCLKPDAPEFPFVIPTMFWRWSHLSSFLTPVITVLVAFFKLVAQLLGLWDGYVDEGPPRNLNLAGEIKIHGTRVAGIPVAATSSWHPGLDSRSQHGHHQPAQPDMGAMPSPVRWEDDQDSMDDDESL